VFHQTTLEVSINSSPLLVNAQTEELSMRLSNQDFFKMESTLLMQIKLQWQKTFWSLMELTTISSITISPVDLARTNRHALTQFSRDLVEDPVPFLLLASDSLLMSLPTHVLSQVK